MSDRQNIVLVTWDSARADHMPMYGYDRETTPHLNSIASGDDAAVFEDVHVPGVGTPTSFTGMFTGEHADATQMCIDPDHWIDANKDRRFLQEALQDAGYYTGGIHANALLSRFYGWDRGWDVFEDNMAGTTDGEDGMSARYDIDIGDSEWWARTKKTRILPLLRRFGLAGTAINAKNILSGSAGYAPWETLWDDVESFVRNAPEPWFLWVLLVDTHHAWVAPPEYREWPHWGPRATLAENYVMRRWPGVIGERHTDIVNAYDNELRHADAFLKKLDSLLAETDNADSPLIVTSDHGDELGEHHDYGHHPAMYDTVTRVPLVMRNVGESGRVAGPHSLTHLASTILDLAGSDERLGARPSLLDEDCDPSRVYIENLMPDGQYGAIASDDGWKLIHNPDGSLEAYQRSSDAHEQKDRTPHHPEILEAALADCLKVDERESSIATRAHSDDAAEDVQEHLASLGYIE